MPDGSHLGGMLDNISTSALLASVFWGGSRAAFCLRLEAEGDDSVPGGTGADVRFVFSPEIPRSGCPWRAWLILAGFIWSKKQGY
jgi:hypothetical protein